MALRDVARGVAAAAGGMVLVGGPTAMQADTWAISNHDTILVALIALIVVGVILALLRALMAPPYLLAINVLSYLAALGATILITEKLFEWEHITTRMRSEAIVHGLKAGTVCALAATGGVPTSTGVILPGTFLILLSQPVKDLVEIRIGVAIGVLIVPSSCARYWCRVSRSRLAQWSAGRGSAGAGVRPGGECS